MPWKSLNGDLLYRIGDILISTNSQNPSTQFGGVWELLCPGRTLVCINTSDSDFNTVQKVGGTKDVTLSTSQIPSHNHGASCAYAGEHTHALSYMAKYNYTNNGWNFYKESTGSWRGYPTYYTESAGSHYHSVTIGYTGGGGSHTNLQPYMAVYMWVRTS